MKNILLTFIATSSLFVSCSNNSTSSNAGDSTGTASVNSVDTAQKSDQPKEKAKSALMTFAESKYDFGMVKDGEKVTHEFTFKNEGAQPLIISNATATCGCTVPEFPKTPIAPGETGVIKVVFDSSGKVGMQNKVVTITSNDYYGTTEIYLTGEVKAK